MRPIRASWPISASLVRTSIAGIVSDLEMESNIRDWQETEDLLFFASFVTETELLKDVYKRQDLAGTGYCSMVFLRRSLKRDHGVSSGIQLSGEKGSL